MPDDVKFFKTPADFRKWLAKSHDKSDEQWVGYYKVASGKPSINWQESVDEALCFGWIDGLRKRIDDEAYKIRFTPRRKRSIWSAKNIASAERLIAEGRMQPPGLRAFEKLAADESRVYAYEQGEGLSLSPEYEKRFKKNKPAWSYYQAQAPWYRRASAHWVMDAKKEETRRRRLEQLIDHSAEQAPIPPLARK